VNEQGGGDVMAKLREYHFSLGDSSDGPIGFCASVEATSKGQAVARLKATLPEDHGISPSGVEGVAYVRVYFNPKAISELDIDDVSDSA
jgi:hypothetical protein